MSSKQITECDGCGQTTDDYYERPGWIHFGETVSVTRSIGRAPDRMAKTDYLSWVTDFCSIDCLRAALDSLRKK